MSRLSIYWPDETEAVTAAICDEPRVLPFPRSQRTRSFQRQFEDRVTSVTKVSTLDVIARARLLFANRQCRCCRSHDVAPVHLDDALVNRQGLEIPGTATIVGFRCHSCDAEWDF
jgi:hypothetical protein